MTRQPRSLNVVFTIAVLLAVLITIYLICGGALLR